MLISFNQHLCLNFYYPCPWKLSPTSRGATAQSIYLPYFHKRFESSLKEKMIMININSQAETTNFFIYLSIEINLSSIQFGKSKSGLRILVHCWFDGQQEHQGHGILSRNQPTRSRIWNSCLLVFLSSWVPYIYIYSRVLCIRGHFWTCTRWTVLYWQFNYNLDYIRT